MDLLLIGRVIQARPKEYAGIFENESSYFIYKFKDKNGAFYRWTGENYTNDKGTVFEVRDVQVTGKVAVWANSKNPDCYTWYKFIEVKNYTSKDFDSIKSQIANDDGWSPDLVSGASNDCIVKSQEEKLELPPIKEIPSNDINKSADGFFNNLYFAGKASDFQADILAEIKQVLQKREEKTFTGKEIGKNVSIIISIDGDDSPEISSLKNQKNSYLHLIFTIKHGKVEFLRMETSDKFGDKLSDICKLIKSKPWAAQAIILYEVADLLDKGIEYLKIPESVWGCTGKDTLYKQIVTSLLKSQISISIADNMLGQRLSAESKFAFVCGLWNGTVDIVQSVPQMVELLTCALHPVCKDQISFKWESFKRMQIYDDQGALLCDSSAYWCKVKELVVAALLDLVADDCKVAHTVGSVVGPVAVMCVGDGAPAAAVIARLGESRQWTEVCH